MDWDMTTYGDDWHTAEDIVSEIYQTIIQEPLIINLRPNDTFRHTLITLCKHAHRDVTKPWRKSLMDRLYEALRPARRTPDDFKSELALGFAELVEVDLMDKTRDRSPPFKTFLLEDLKRWRKFRQASENAKAKDIAKAMKPAVRVCGLAQRNPARRKDKARLFVNFVFGRDIWRRESASRSQLAAWAGEPKKAEQMRKTAEAG